MRFGVVRGWGAFDGKFELARKLRREQTGAERLVWQIVRDRRCLGLKFRRQVVISGYIVDFYCAELRLVLEVDGEVHATPEQLEHDTLRDRRLRSRGFRVLRIANGAITRETLEWSIRSLTLHPLPIGRGGPGG